MITRRLPCRFLDETWPAPSGIESDEKGGALGNYDVLVVGGGPAGLAAALTLGRARRRVLLCDDSTRRRNLPAEHLQNFVTRDGTPPDEFRGVAAGELARYPNVQRRADRIEAVRSTDGVFTATLSAGELITARRVVLCTGMIDVPPDLPGMTQLWGKSVFQCPYCHGWEIQNQRFAYWASKVELLEFALLLRGWSRDVVVLTNGQFPVPEAATKRLADGCVTLDQRIIARLDGDGTHLRSIVFTAGDPMLRDVLFLHPPQRQVDIVANLGVQTDARGFVQVDDAYRTSIPGVYAAGDLITERQAAIVAAAAGMRAAASLNQELTVELAIAGELDSPPGVA
jgi:thioredoxin reductase